MKELSSRKLFLLLGKFSLFSHFSVDRISTRDASNISFMIWPNGSPCIIGNLYIQSLLTKGRSGGRRGLTLKGRKGGSVGEYAAKISQLLKRCYRDGFNPIEINDSKFTDYVEEIRKEPNKKNPAHDQKTEASVVAVGRVWLDFLGFVGRFHGDSNFVSPEGTIRAHEETYTIVSKSGTKIKRSYLTHHSLGVGRRFNTRRPVTKEQVTLLKSAIRKINSSSFVKQRRRCMIELFNDTGARRTEIRNIKVDDILNAYHMDSPLLRLDTLKQGDDSERYIPVTKMLLHDIKNFIQIARREKIRNVYKDGKDHGFLFISETTARPLASDTLGNEISTLRIAANINTQVCAHMFRHAFITNLFVTLIKRHEMSTKDDFRKALLDSKTFILEIQQWTGHIETSSVEHYIDLAFSRLSDYSETISSVHMIRAADIFNAKMEDLMQQLEDGSMDIKAFRKEVQILMQLRDDDFKAAQDRESMIN